MKTKYWILTLLLASTWVGSAISQDKRPAPKAEASTDHEAPAQA